jgi:serine/threonine protein kinase
MLKEFRGWLVVQPFPAEGGEADVYLVEQGQQQRVLKVYRFGIIPNATVLEKAARLGKTHPELFPGLLEFGFAPELDCHFEMTEYLSGGTLAALLARRPLEEPEIRLILQRSFQALARLHESGIVHLDVKPANILLRSLSPLEPVLSDFGISSIFETEQSHKATVVKGSDLYRSPESLSGVIQPKSDFWSLGMVMLEILSGAHPFAGLQQQVIHYQLTTRGVAVPAHLDANWQTLLQGLLTRNPEHRWGAAQIQDWLDGKAVANHPQSDQDALAAQSPALLPSAAFSVSRRFSAPLECGSRVFSTLEEFCRWAFAAPEAWNQALELMQNGSIVVWLKNNEDDERAAKLAELLASSQFPQLGLFTAGIFFCPDLDLVWGGIPLDEPHLIGALQKVAASGATKNDEELVKAILTGKLLPTYRRFTGKSLGKLEAVLKWLKALEERDLKGLGIKRNALVLFFALSGAYALRGAYALLQETVRGQSPGVSFFEALDLPEVLRFGQKAGLLQPVEAEVWGVFARAWKLLKKDPSFKPDEFPDPGETGIADLRQEKSLRELVSKLCGVPPLDLGLIQQIEMAAPNRLWLQNLVKYLYRLPPTMPLEDGFANLLLMSVMLQRFPELSKTYLLPPFMERLCFGKFVSGPEVKLARKILDTPEILVKTRSSVKTWVELVSLAAPPKHLNPHSLAYLQHLKALESQLLLSEGKGAVVWSLDLFFDAFVICLALPISLILGYFVATVLYAAGPAFFMGFLAYRIAQSRNRTPRGIIKTLIIGALMIVIVMMIMYGLTTTIMVE